MVRGNEMKDLASVDSGREEQEADGDSDAGPEDKSLDDVGPDDGFETSDEGVEDGDEAENDDDAGEAPASDAANG